MTEDTVDKIVVTVSVVLIWAFCTRQLHNIIRGKRGSAERHHWESHRQIRRARKKNREKLPASGVFYLDTETEKHKDLFTFLRLWGWVKQGDMWTNVRTRWEREVEDDVHSYHLTLWFGADTDKEQT